MKLFVTLGVDINSREEDASTAMHMVAGEGHLEALRELAKMGANIDAKNMYGFPPISFAAVHGNLVSCIASPKVTVAQEIMRELIALGEDIETEYSDGTVLHEAVRNNQLIIVKVISIK